MTATGGGGAASRPPALDFRQLVFSGGGLRCFWQGGFMDVIDSAGRPQPERVTGVSGGAMSAAAWIGGIEARIFETMRDRFAEQDSNVNWEMREGDGLTPHQRIYREVVSETLDDEVVGKVADGPDFHVLLAHPPSDRLGQFTGSASALTYQTELYSRSSPHFEWPEKLGVGSSFVDARAAAREGRLRELICAAVVIPPVFELPEWNGRKVIDGGMADQAPMPEPDEGRTLVLLTRLYESLPEVEGRLYVLPSEETEADKIDFTDPGKLQSTWDLGRADGRRFLEDHNIQTKEET